MDFWYLETSGITFVIMKGCNCFKLIPMDSEIDHVISEIVPFIFSYLILIMRITTETKGDT